VKRPFLSLATVGTKGGVASTLQELPTAAGVAQVLGPDGRVLVTSRAGNVRRWAASRLGAGRPPRKGARPSTDLSPIATAVVYALTSSSFHQRLAYERLMAPLVPVSARRDLKPPVYLHLDPGERFPRLTLRTLGAERAGLFGPFRDKVAAGRARDAIHKHFPLRPCEYTFEPDPELPLGLGCLFAQVRTCAAPCLARVSEEAYRELALAATRFLGQRDPGAEPRLPDWVTSAEASRGLVVETGRAGLELYPVWNGAVLEERAVTLAAADDPGAGVAGLSWEDPEAPRDDMPWLSAWLHAPRRTGHHLVVGDLASLPERVRALKSS
jgi:hypothetical protein